MTCKERQQCYDNWQAYRQRREDFNQEVLRWFEDNYKPNKNTMQ